MNLKKTLIIIGSCLVFFIVMFNSCEIGPKKYIYDNQYRIVNPKDINSYISKSGKGYSNKKFTIDYISFTGRDTIWNFEVNKNSEIIFKYNSEVYSGDFKVVMVSDEKKIENIFQGSVVGEKTFKLDKGNYVLKIVGRNANGHIQTSISENENIKVTLNNN